MNPEFDLSGKAAIVTGASRSMGRATAITLAEAGADVVLCGRWLEGLERVADEVADQGTRSIPVVCDVSDPEAVENLVQVCQDSFGKIDILIANAGVFPGLRPAEEVTLESWDRVMATNLRGVMLTCIGAGRKMIEQGGGSIVTISSIEGHVALEGDFPYIASKHGVIGLTKSLAVEWAKFNVRVNTISPGFIMRDEEQLVKDPAIVELVTTRTPLGRWGSGREVGLAVTFLASPAASYITGATLAVDGGWLAL
jgi:NAD(P)-dependent dehydrogenase (short-subunit alcohol dehydrogenase family)